MTLEEIERSLIAALKGPKMEVSVADLRKGRLLTILREWRRAHRKPKSKSR
jgi:hypothetical protein